MNRAQKQLLKQFSQRNLERRAEEEQTQKPPSQKPYIRPEKQRRRLYRSDGYRRKK